MSDKLILCLDFDGVLHKYVSGWQGARRIPDGPVDGAIPWLIEALSHFNVCILSSRSHQWGGRRAMKRWLHIHLCIYMEKHLALAQRWADNPHELDDERLADDAASGVLALIRFPRHKPPAHLTLDDRAWPFNGRFPDFYDLKRFTPWNRTRGNNPPHEKPEPTGAP